MQLRRLRRLACVAALGGAWLAQAQTVVLTGILGNKALLVVNGAPPRSVAVGQSHLGVRVLAVDAHQAEIEVGGARQTLRLGEAPMSTVAAGDGDRGRIVLHAGSGGHFRAQGQINGRTVTFLVDTGASAVAISTAEADAIGLRYQAGTRVPIGTANGVIVGWRTSLTSVRLGDVAVHGVDALVTPAPMPHVLLGNSFLSRFQMTRTNDQLVLERRY